MLTSLSYLEGGGATRPRPDRTTNGKPICIIERIVVWVRPRGVPQSPRAGRLMACPGCSLRVRSRPRSCRPACVGRARRWVRLVGVSSHRHRLCPTLTRSCSPAWHVLSMHSRTESILLHPLIMHALELAQVDFNRLTAAAAPTSRPTEHLRQRRAETGRRRAARRSQRPD